MSIVGSQPATLADLHKYLSKDARSADWHKRLAWLTSAEARCFPSPWSRSLTRTNSITCLLQLSLEAQPDWREWQHIMQGCLELMEDAEVRVREAVAICTEMLAQEHPGEVVQAMQPDILQSIERHWVRYSAVGKHCVLLLPTAQDTHRCGNCLTDFLLV